MDGVVTITKSGGQYQVVIGNHVPEVYADVCAAAGLGDGAPSAQEAPAQKKNLFNAFIDTVSGIFQPMLGLVIGAILCYPGIQGSALSAGGELLYTLFEGTMFESAVYTTFFGLPMLSMDYTGTVIPVIFVVYFAARCERFFSRFIPDLVKFFFVPMLTLLVSIPLGFLIIGPLAIFGSNLIAGFVMAVRNVSPMIAGAIVGLTW